VQHQALDKLPSGHFHQWCSQCSSQQLAVVVYCTCAKLTHTATVLPAGFSGSWQWEPSWLLSLSCCCCADQTQHNSRKGPRAPAVILLGHGSKLLWPEQFAVACMYTSGTSGASRVLCNGGGGVGGAEQMVAAGLCRMETPSPQTTRPAAVCHILAAVLY
jgi:hypothetical protein